MAQSSAYKKRMERNLALLEIKKQDVENRFGEGRITVDIEGTKREMSPMTILAIPQGLRQRGKAASRTLKVLTYDKPGADGKLLGEKIIRPSNRTVDIDDLLNDKLGDGTVTISPSRAETVIDQVNLPPVEADEDTEKPGVDTVEPVVPVEQPTVESPKDFGKVVKKPRSKKSVSSVKVSEDDEDLGELARKILGL